MGRYNYSNCIVYIPHTLGLVKVQKIQKWGIIFTFFFVLPYNPFMHPVCPCIMQSDIYKCNNKRFLDGHIRAHGYTFVCLQ